MLRLVWRDLLRRPLRHGLAVLGVAVAVGALAALSAFGTGYRHALGLELDRMGVQLMLVPLGCPYDAAARVLKGNLLEASLPDSAVSAVRNDPDVALAAPLLIVAPRPNSGARADVWVGLDDSGRSLKPWWRAKAGSHWFADRNDVILGSEAAEVEMRAPGDKLYSPETGCNFRVAGVLERSGTADDNLFFVALSTAQAVFRQPGRVTAVAIRLRDPALLPQVSTRLQEIPGAQVVTMTEVMGTFLNLVGALRTLSRAVALVALTVSLLTVLNTLLAAVTERAGELAVLRALGASRAQIFQLLALQSVVMTSIGSMVGLGFVAGAGRWLEYLGRQFVPFAPRDAWLVLTSSTLLQCTALGVAVGLIASVYPAWRASQTHPAQAIKAS